MRNKTRQFVRVTKFLLAGVTLFCVSWIACVNEWHAGLRWSGRRGDGGRSFSTMRTIVAYSVDKQAEMDRPSPIACDRLPVFPDIPFINRTWSPGVAPKSSWQHVAGTRVSLYAAYYDQRAAQRYVRILATFHGRNLSADDTLFCQTRSLNPCEDFIEVVTAKPLNIWWHNWDATSSKVETPLLLSCPLTKRLYGPSIVSVVTQPCNDPTNAFLLELTQENSKYNRTFTACVKDMNFDKDISQNLVEWIEINKLLGMNIIDIYVDRISKETEKKLLYYRDKGFVRLFHVPIRHKRERSLWQRRRDHIVTYNDCLYRNIRESEFIIPLDVDEILLPKIAYTLPELLNRLTKHGWNSSLHSAVMIRNAFFFDFMQGVDTYKSKNVHPNETKTYEKRDDVRIKDSKIGDIGEIELRDNTVNIISEVNDIKEKVLYEKYKSNCGYEMPVPKLVSHIVRSAVISPVGYSSKSLMVTKKVLTAFNHYPLASVGALGFAGWPAPFSEVQLNHYKESCNTTVVAECTLYGRRAHIDHAALRLRRRLVRALAASASLCTRLNIT